MFEGITKFFRKIGKKNQEELSSRDTAKERLHLVLMQDRANVSADFLEMMKQEIIEVIKKYIDVDEKEIDVRLTNKTNEDGTTGAPALYANIPIAGIKQEINTDKKDIVEEIKKDAKINNKNDLVEESDKEKLESKEDKGEVNKEQKEKEESQENKEIEEDNKNNNDNKKQVSKKPATKKSEKRKTTNNQIKQNEKSEEKVNKPKKN